MNRFIMVFRIYQQLVFVSTPLLFFKNKQITKKNTLLKSLLSLPERNSFDNYFFCLRLIIVSLFISSDDYGYYLTITLLLKQSNFFHRNNIMFSFTAMLFNQLYARVTNYSHVQIAKLAMRGS